MNCSGRKQSKNMMSFYYYNQNPSGVCILVQIKAFVIQTPLGLPNLNAREIKKDAGCSSKMSPSCKWPILPGYVLQYCYIGESLLELSYVYNIM